MKNTVLGQCVILLVSPGPARPCAQSGYFLNCCLSKRGLLSQILFQHMRNDVIQSRYCKRFILFHVCIGVARGLQQGPLFCFRRLCYSPAPMPIIFNQPLLRKWQQEKLEFSAWLPLSPVPLLLTAVCLRRSSVSPTVRCLIVRPVAHILPAT